MYAQRLGNGGRRVLLRAARKARARNAARREAGFDRLRRGAAVKYRYTIVAEGVVEADNKAEAEAAAFQSVDEGAGVFACEVEPLTKERDE